MAAPLPLHRAGASLEVEIEKNLIDVNELPCAVVPSDHHLAIWRDSRIAIASHQAHSETADDGIDSLCSPVWAAFSTPRATGGYS
jgi:hypothetical protein